MSQCFRMSTAVLVLTVGSAIFGRVNPAQALNATQVFQELISRNQQEELHTVTTLDEWIPYWGKNRFGKDARPFVVSMPGSSPWANDTTPACGDIVSSYGDFHVKFQDFSFGYHEKGVEKYDAKETLAAAAQSFRSCKTTTGEEVTEIDVGKQSDEAQLDLDLKNIFSTQLRQDIPLGATLTRLLKAYGYNSNFPEYVEANTANEPTRAIVDQMRKDDLLRPAEPPMEVDPDDVLVYLYIGLPLSGSFLHNHGSGCAYSDTEKLWILMSPEQICKFRRSHEWPEPLPDSESIVDMHPLTLLQYHEEMIERGIKLHLHRQRPGEYLCFPERWFHATVNYDTMTSLGFILPRKYADWDLKPLGERCRVQNTDSDALGAFEEDVDPDAAALASMSQNAAEERGPKSIIAEAEAQLANSEHAEARLLLHEAMAMAEGNKNLVEKIRTKLMQVLRVEFDVSRPLCSDVRDSDTKVAEVVEQGVANGLALEEQGLLDQIPAALIFQMRLYLARGESAPIPTMARRFINALWEADDLSLEDDSEVPRRLQQYVSLLDHPPSLVSALSNVVYVLRWGSYNKFATDLYHKIVDHFVWILWPFPLQTPPLTSADWNPLMHVSPDVATPQWAVDLANDSRLIPAVETLLDVTEVDMWGEMRSHWPQRCTETAAAKELLLGLTPFPSQGGSGWQTDGIGEELTEVLQAHINLTDSNGFKAATLIAVPPGTFRGPVQSEVQNSLGTYISIPVFSFTASLHVEYGFQGYDRSKRLQEHETATFDLTFSRSIKNRGSEMWVGIFIRYGSVAPALD